MNLIENQNEQTYEDLLCNYIQSNEKIRDKVKNTFICLKRNLEEIGKCGIVDSILKMEFIQQEEYISNEEDSDYEDFEDCVNRLPAIYQYNMNHSKECFRCICGKNHLKFLNLFTHNDLNTGENLIIGSSCIDNIRIIGKAYEENIELQEKIKSIVSKIEDIEREKHYKKCLKCKDRTIRIDYEYKTPYRDKFCNKCIIAGNMITCNNCNKLIEINNNTYNKAYKLQCRSCYFKSK